MPSLTGYVSQRPGITSSIRFCAFLVGAWHCGAPGTVLLARRDAALATPVCTENLARDEAPRYLNRDRIGIGSTAALSRAAFTPWASGTSYGTGLTMAEFADGYSDVSGGSVLIILLSSARHTCAASCEPTLVITMTTERIDHWIKMRRPRARFSGSDLSITHDPWRTSSPLCAGLGFRYTAHGAQRWRDRSDRSKPAEPRKGPIIVGAGRAGYIRPHPRQGSRQVPETR